MIGTVVGAVAVLCGLVSATAGALLLWGGWGLLGVSAVWVVVGAVLVDLEVMYGRAR